MKMYITINYKNGNTIKNAINYLHFENDEIVFTMDRQVHSIIQNQVRILLSNITSFDIESEVK